MTVRYKKNSVRLNVMYKITKNASTFPELEFVLRKKYCHGDNDFDLLSILCVFKKNFMQWGKVGQGFSSKKQNKLIDLHQIVRNLNKCFISRCLLDPQCI